MAITFEQIQHDPQVRAYIQMADETLDALGYTEHSFPHVTKAALLAAEILKRLDFPPREQELAAIAAFLHDIGNVVNRHGHEQSGALMAFSLLKGLGADPLDTAAIISAIGNHDENTAFPVSSIAAALILADKTDVRRSRVRHQETIALDIHDRVNYAVKESVVDVDKAAGEIVLKLTIDTKISLISEYFEIFLNRMLLCRKAAQKLGVTFRLVINEQSMM